jgi:hypothetical protein
VRQQRDAPTLERRTQRRLRDQAVNPEFHEKIVTAKDAKNAKGQCARRAKNRFPKLLASLLDVSYLPRSFINQSSLHSFALPREARPISSCFPWRSWRPWRFNFLP